MEEEEKKAEELGWTSSMGEEGPDRGPTTSGVTLPKLLALLAARKEERRVRLRSTAAPEPVSKGIDRRRMGARNEEAFALWHALRGAGEKEVAELVFYNIVPRWVGVQLLAGIEPWNVHEFVMTSRRELVDAAKRLLDLEEEMCGVDDWGSLLDPGEKMSDVLKACMRQVESREKQEVARFQEAMREIREGMRVEVECYGPMRDVLWALYCDVDELPGADRGYAQRFEWEGEGMRRADWVTELRVKWAVVKMPEFDVWEDWQSFVAAKGASLGCLEENDREALHKWRQDGKREPELMAEWRRLTADWAKWREKKKGAGCLAAPCNMDVNDVPAQEVQVEVEVDERSLTTWRKKKSSNDSGGGGGASVPHETHVHDLPDECLLDILSRIHTSNHLPPNLHDHFWVEHPLQCAVVCKRWHALADAVVVKMRLPKVHLPHNMALTQNAINRFTNVTSLTLSVTTYEAAFVVLADSTLQLQHLALDITMYARNLDDGVDVMAQALPRLTSLRVLDLGQFLSYCRMIDVKAILNAIASMPSLQHLSFSYSHGDLMQVCRQVAKVTGLETLQLGCSQVPFVMGSGFLHKVLRKLTLHDKPHYQYDDDSLELEDLGRFTGLEVLHVKNFQDSNYTSLPDSLRQLSYLRELVLDNCRTSIQLPTSLGHLSSLQILQVEYLETWPDDLEILKRLQTLRMTECRNIPHSLTLLTRLESLSVTGCDDLPFSLTSTSFPHLTQFSIRRCDITALCLASLGMLTKLTVLDIQNCHLKALPDSLRHLASLQTCTLAHLPHLQFLPDGISEWRRLTMLDISHCCSLQTLPARLGELTALRMLSLKCCTSFASLPRSMASLHCLQVLVVVVCHKLTELPVGVGDLRALRVIKVDASLELPESLRQQSYLPFHWPEQL